MRILKTSATYAIIAATASVLTGACASEPTAAVALSASRSAAGRAESTVRWNEFARALIVKAKPNQQEALRALAYLSLAQHQAALSQGPGAGGRPA